MIWDNDDEGRRCFRNAKKMLGPNEAKKWCLIPMNKMVKNRRLENLLEKSDLMALKTTSGIPKNSSFEKVVINLYQKSNRKKIINNLSNKTKENFEEVIDLAISKL